MIRADGILRLVAERGPLCGPDAGQYERLTPCGHLVLYDGTPRPYRRCAACARPDDEQPALFEAGETG